MEKLKKYSLEIFICLIGLSLIHSFLLTDAFSGSTVNADKAEKFGSFVGGYIGSIFTLISILLLVRTLRDQSRNNFENNFLELVKIHRDNVEKMELQDHNSYKVFVMYVREFRALLAIVKDVAVHYGLKFDTDENKAKILNITYLAFFFGTGPNSSRVLRKNLKDLQKDMIDNLELKIDESKNEIRGNLRLGYIPFEGHQSRLGHYFRHLYHTVNFAHDSRYSFKTKYQLIKILRTQLTNHEQALLFFNSLSSIGSEWKDRKLIENYQLIKNMPEGFIDDELEINPKNLYNIKFEHED